MWEDTQYDAFEQHVEELAERMRITASHFTTVGEVLVSIADEFEMRWTELMGLSLSAVGAIVAIAGVAVLVYTGVTGVGAIVGMVIALIGAVIAVAGYFIALINAAQTRLEELRDATEQLHQVAPPTRWVEPDPA